MNLIKTKNQSKIYITKAPTRHELIEVLSKIIHQTVKYFERRDLIVKKEDDDYLLLNLIEAENLLSSIEAGIDTYKLTIGIKGLG
jgi:hypothetical protein